MPQIQRPLITNADTLEHRGFLLAEDEALKQHLSGITVPDVRPGKEGQSTKMGVWYRFPEGERQIKYPFATIDMLSIEPRFDLFTSDHSMDPYDTYWPSTYPGPAPLPPGKMGWHIEPFLPFQIVYQVAVHSRSAAHDRYLTSLFTTDVFQPRPWWLMVDADNTYRRTELLSFNAADLAETTESGTKRIFRKVWTISMQAEIPQQPLFEWDGDGWPKVPSLFYQALKVLIPIVEREKVDGYMQSVLSGHLDPLNEVPEGDRTDAGELTFVTHGDYGAHTRPPLVTESMPSGS